MWYYVSVDLFWNYVSLNVSQRSLVCGESTIFASAFSLCFFGLRVGEITSQSKGRAGKHVIHISDIKLVRKQDSVDLHLMIRSSKTDQHSPYSERMWSKMSFDFTK
jgi:hypothetical protein